jgi:hypothetical protein
LLEAGGPCSLFAPENSVAATKEPEDQRKHQADQDASSQGKVEGGALAAKNEVAGQPAQGQVQASGKQQHRASNHDDATENQKKFPKIRHARETRCRRKMPRQPFPLAGR